MDKAKQRAITVSLRPGLSMAMNERKVFNGGYLALSKVYHQLGINGICRDILSGFITGEITSVTGIGKVSENQCQWESKTQVGY